MMRKIANVSSVKDGEGEMFYSNPAVTQVQNIVSYALSVRSFPLQALPMRGEEMSVRLSAPVCLFSVKHIRRAFRAAERS